jgi:hypothetical protein
VVPRQLRQLLSALEDVSQVEEHILVDVALRERLSRKTKLFQDVALSIYDLLLSVSEMKRVKIYQLHIGLAFFPSLSNLQYIVYDSDDIFDLPGLFLDFSRNEQCSRGDCHHVAPAE